MSAPVPKTMKALVTQADHTAAVKEIPVPTIDDDEVLVQTVALAQNPTDWKCTFPNFSISRNHAHGSRRSTDAKNITNEGTICGCDWSGNVVQIGKNVTTVAVGDFVAGFVQGGTYTDRGAFAEYVKTPAELTWKVPAGSVSYEEAATLGCA